MSSPAEKYQKVNEWILSNILPDLDAIQGSLKKITEAMGESIEQFEPYTYKITTLVEVGEEVDRIEECINQITKLHDKSYEIRVIPPIGELPEVEKIIEFMLPKIDDSLNVIEEAMIIINDAVCHIELEPTPQNYSEQSLLQRQARLIDKIQRIKQNLSSQENILVTLPPPVVTPDTELLYVAPPWSVPPETKFYFEVRRGDQVVATVDISESGHYLLGRLPICDIVMNDETCSRQHAVIQFRPSDPDETGDVNGPTDEIYIYDLGSTSGTYVNGMPLQGNAYYPLYPGDILQFGQFPNAFVIREGEYSGEPLEGTTKSTEEIETISRATTIPPKEEPQLLDEDASADSITPEVKETKKESEPSADFQDRSTEEGSRSNTPPKEIIEEKKNETSQLERQPSLDTSIDDFPDMPQQNQKKSAVKPIIQIVKPTKLKPVESLDPKSSDFDQEAYKRQMIEAYQRQQQENEELLRKQKEREEQGLPPVVYVPYVPERPKKKKWPFGIKK